MNVLLIGSGGREHALAWKLDQSHSVAKIICPNGNPGIAMLAETPRVDLRSPEDWASYAIERGVDLVAIGPEAPLAAGVANACCAKGLPVFGPSREAAEIEASKAFAKDVMRAADVPTAESGSFSDPTEAVNYARGLGVPVVVKADGLAAGKGVAICHSLEDAERAIRENLVENRFGDSSSKVLVEQFLEGEEASIFALTDGQDVALLAPSQDHKRAYDGDKGPNTGGMGAYAPAPAVTEEVLSAALGSVIRPVLSEMDRRGRPYRGVLYAGLMLTRNGVEVLEFNCRFGDPETQALMPLLDGDLGEIMMACATGCLGRLMAPGGSGVRVRPGSSACVVLASGGYPGRYRKGMPIGGLESLENERDGVVFHAGTAEQDGRVVTNGGRVLGVTAWGTTLRAAVDHAYAMADAISFDGKMLRRDIAHRAL